ncbi:basic proline-rich protein-like [Zonotrichia leucophrys gambelii]|uniref:basic proline-rich protein-like n=1 Tax=Zonotrichia leucophrys gambelii TaxID=257770 RepID=UPI003140207F
MAPGGQWLRRGPVPACAAAAPAPRPLPCPALPPPRGTAGSAAPSAPYVPRRTKFARPRGATHPHTGLRGEDARLGSEEGCHELLSSRGRAGGDARRFLLRPCRAPHRGPNPSEGSKCLRPPGSRFQSGFSAGERARGNSAGERRANPPFPPYFCGVSPPPPLPPSPAPSAPAAPSPRPPAGPSQHKAPRPTLPAPPPQPPPRPRNAGPARRPRPRAAPAPPAPRQPRSGGGQRGHGLGSEQGRAASLSAADIAARAAGKRRGRRTDPTRPDPAGWGGHGGGAGGRARPQHCSLAGGWSGAANAAGAAARPPRAAAHDTAPLTRRFVRRCPRRAPLLPAPARGRSPSFPRSAGCRCGRLGDASARAAGPLHGAAGARPGQSLRPTPRRRPAAAAAALARLRLRVRLRERQRGGGEGGRGAVSGAATGVREQAPGNTAATALLARTHTRTETHTHTHTQRHARLLPLPRTSPPRAGRERASERCCISQVPHKAPRAALSPPGSHSPSPPGPPTRRDTAGPAARIARCPPR